MKINKLVTNLNSDKIKKRATSSTYLKNRISLNKKYQKFDFNDWQFNNYKKIIKNIFFKYINKKIRILDIGSGNGLQVSQFIQIFNDTEIYCVDFSKKSLIDLKQKYNQKKKSN